MHFPPFSQSQATTKTLAQQQEQLKKIETIGTLQETNKILKMDRDKLQQELQQAQARVSLLHCFPYCQLFFHDDSSTVTSFKAV